MATFIPMLWLIPFCAGTFLILANYVYFYHSLFKNFRGSWIPLSGTVLCGLGLQLSGLVSPIVAWLGPFLLDPGGFLMFIAGPIVSLHRSRAKKRTEDA